MGIERKAGAMVTKRVSLTTILLEFMVVNGATEIRIVRLHASQNSLKNDRKWVATVAGVRQVSCMCDWKLKE